VRNFNEAAAEKNSGFFIFNGKMLKNLTKIALATKINSDNYLIT